LSNLDSTKKLIENANKLEAFNQLYKRLNADPRNIEVWFLMAEAVDNRSKKADCYRQIIKLDPDNQLAQQKLQELVTRPSITQPSKQMASQFATIPNEIKPRNLSLKPTSPNKIKGGLFGLNYQDTVLVVIAGLVFIILLIILINFAFSGITRTSTVLTLPKKTEVSKLNVFIDLSIDLADKTHPFISGMTNLPNDTLFMVSIKGNTFETLAQDKVFVVNGKFKAGPFGPEEGLASGNYIAEVFMPIAQVQSDSVRDVIGENGEDLIGTQVVNDSAGILVVASKEFQIISPTSTNIPKPTSTPRPKIITLHGGDIGKKWEDSYVSMSLLNVYETDIIDGERPSGSLHGGYEHGFTLFLVVEITYENRGFISDDFDPSSYTLTSYDNEGNFEYMADIFPDSKSTGKRLYQGESIRTEIAYEIKQTSHNFIMCWKMGPGFDWSNKVGECPSYSYPFKFGD
jgi:hypothetical protein